MIYILNLARQWGWMPHDIAEMPAEWALNAKEFSSAMSFIRSVKSGK